MIKKSQQAVDIRQFLIALLLFFLPFFSFLAQAEIYQWTDNDGKKYFSDKKHQGAKTLQINAGYTYHAIKKIYDGDTILLENGSKIRFLGINTPEVERRSKAAEKGGKEAKAWLINKLKNKKVRLERDVEKQDKYGRLLAYIFTKEKENINLELVKSGLASVNIHPPNLKYTEVLVSAERQAEKGQLGLWQYSEYTPKTLDTLNRKNTRGWQRVVGEIQNVHHTRKYSYLNFSASFSVKVEHKWQSLFPDLESYLGKKVEVRGWINRNKNRYSMLIRHPSNLLIL